MTNMIPKKTLGAVLTGGFALALDWYAKRTNPASQDESSVERVATGFTGFGNDVAASMFKNLLKPSMGHVHWLPSLYSGTSSGSVVPFSNGLFMTPLQGLFNTKDLSSTSDFLPLFTQYIAKRELAYGGVDFIKRFARSSRPTPVNTELGPIEVLDEPTEAGREMGDLLSRAHVDGVSQVKPGKGKKAHGTAFVTGSSKQHGYVAIITTYNPELYRKLEKNTPKDDAKVFMTWFGGIPGIPGVLVNLEKFSMLTSGTYDKRRGRDLPISSKLPGNEGTMQQYFSPPKGLAALTDFPKQVFELLGRDIVHCSPSIINMMSGTRSTGFQRLVAVQMNTWPGYHSLAGVLLHGHYIDSRYPGYVTRIIAGHGYSEGVSDAKTQSLADCLNVPAGIALWFSAALMQDQMMEHRRELEARFKCKIYNLADKMVAEKFAIRDADGEVLTHEYIHMPWWYGAKDLLTSSGDSSLYNLQRLFYLIGKGGTPAMHQVQRNVIPVIRDLTGAPSSVMPDEDDEE